MSTTTVSGAAAALMRVQRQRSADEAGPLWPSVSEIEDLIRRKFEADGDDFGRALLKDLAERPEEPDAEAALAVVLTSMARADDEFADALEALVVAAARSDEFELGQLEDEARARVERLRHP